jgi:hypothetical protein
MVKEGGPPLCLLQLGRGSRLSDRQDVLRRCVHSIVVDFGLGNELFVRVLFVMGRCNVYANAAPY